MDLSLLRTFVAVYRAGSFTAAAPVLGLSQPTVTAQIRALEGELGRQLFERLPRGVAPTSVADELAREVAPHIDALASITEPSPSPGPVHLAGPAELTAICALPALADLGVRLRVTLGLADDLLSGLRAGRYDLVISTVRPRGRAIAATPLIDEEFVLVAAASWRGGRDGPLITYADDLPIIRRYWRSVFGTRPPGEPAIVVPDLRAVRACAIAGGGVTVLPRYLCDEDLREGRLVTIHEPEIPPINTLFLATRAGHVTPHVAAVRDRLLAASRTWISTRN